MIDIHSLGPTAGDLLYRDDTVLPVLEVRELNGVRWLHFGGRAIQSVMSLEQPAEVVLPYLQCMLAVLLFQPVPSRVLNLGLGGGVFDRYFGAHYPGVEIISVEQDPRVVAIASRYFDVDTRHCRFEGAEEFLARSAANSSAGADVAKGYEKVREPAYDLILCDLYDGDAIPAILLEEGTHRNLASLVTPSGVVAYNLLPGNQSQLLELLKMVRRWLPFAAILEVPDYRNLVLLASLQPLVRAESGVLPALPDVGSFLDTIRYLPSETRLPRTGGGPKLMV